MVVETKCIFEGEVNTLDEFQIMLQEIYSSTSLSPNDKIIASENYLEELLKHDPQNTTLWFTLAVHVLEVPEVDYRKSIHCMERILSYDQRNIEAVLFLACIQYLHQGYIEDSVDKLLDFSVQSECDHRTKSLCLMAKAWSCEGRLSRRSQEYISYLEQSVQYDDSYVSNLLNLASAYNQKGETEKGNQLLHRALRNIECIYVSDRDSCLSILEPYLGESFIGFVPVPLPSYPSVASFKDDFILEVYLDAYRVSEMIDKVR